MDKTESHTIYSLKSILDGVGVRINELNSRMGGAIYVKAEISEFKFKPGVNHQYFTLVEKNGDKVEAKVSAHIWKNIAPKVLNDFYSATGQKLEAGMEVAFLVSFDFSPLYGLSLNILGIDASFTLGNLARTRRETIRRLEDEGLMDLNASLRLPDIPNRIAVISSNTAAGYEDFLHKLQIHPEYRFDITLYPAIMQGQKAPAEIVAALKSIQKDIESNSKEFDFVAIMRGGGAEIDLVCFDDYNLCAEIARFPIPVLTGIGHTKDIAVADMVANQTKNTPTGLADYILEIISDAAQELNDCIRELVYVVESEFERDKAFLNNYLSNLESSINLYLKEESHSILDIEKEINNVITRRFSAEKNKLSNVVTLLNNCVNSRFIKEKHRMEKDELLLSALSPDEMLKRGYSLTFKDGKIANLKDIKEGDALTTMFLGGKVESVVNKIEIDNK